MLTSPTGDARRHVRRLAATLYCYAFLDDFVLLYPVYALLFADTGLSTAQISSLFVIWSLTSLLLEIPSGAWADAVSRRLLLCVGPLCTAAGYAVWVLAPSYWAFALGFVLWGLEGALQSGALEALVYEELDRVGAAARYARTMGRARTAGIVAVVAATTAAGPTFATGSYAVVGGVSVAACLLTAVAGARLPEHREPAPTGGDPTAGGYVAALRAGLAEARGDRSVQIAVALVIGVTAIWGALEEYDPLLIQQTGVPEATVPPLTLVIWVGVTGGGLLAGAGQRMPVQALAATLAAAAIALATGAASGHPAGVALIALAFGAFQMAGVVADARLQERISGPSRATVTSLAGLGTDVATIGVYGSYAAASTAAPHRVVFAAFAVPYLLIALGLARARPATPARPPVTAMDEPVALMDEPVTQRPPAG